MQNTILFDNGYLQLSDVLGLPEARVLQHLEITKSQFVNGQIKVSLETYFKYWQFIDDETSDPNLAITIAEHLQNISLSSSSFDPCSFAALCSPNMEMALKRIGKYKALVGPMKLTYSQTDKGLNVKILWLDIVKKTPNLLNEIFLVYLVQIARQATREVIKPLKVALPCHVNSRKKLTTYFGKMPNYGDIHEITFKNADIKKPFVTHNLPKWLRVEKSLQKQMQKLMHSTPIHERVRVELLETLPSGETIIEKIALRLGMSKRTLQRRLLQEGQPFKEIVRATREKLAKHYIINTDLAYHDIAFLIGFEEVTSFYRAFKSWTNQTADHLRQRNRV